MVGLAVLVAASLVTSDVTSIAVAALVAGALVVGVLVRFALGPWRWAARATTQVLAAGLVWPAVFWAVTLRAPDVTPPARPVPGQHIWQLSTGSRIAYVHFVAHGARRGAPIVFLHGGPAVSELRDVQPIFRRLAATGRIVLRRRSRRAPGGHSEGRQIQRLASYPDAADLAGRRNTLTSPERPLENPRSAMTRSTTGVPGPYGDSSCNSITNVLTASSHPGSSAKI